MRARLVLVGCCLVGLGACGGDDTYVIVTVDARPAVRNASKLTVALSNAGTTRSDSLVLDGQAFPVTFSISTPGRAGALEIAIDATDERDLVVGRGSASTTVDAADARLVLDAADFVVNTDYAADQFPADDFEAIGFQLAATPAGTWTAAFRDTCATGSCDVFARRFDQHGTPVTTAVSASDNAFKLTSKLTARLATPAIAASATTTLALWDFSDIGVEARGVACRTLDAAGNANALQVPITAEIADVVSVAAMANGNFVASWVASGVGVRAMIVKPDCTGGAVLPVSAAGATLPHRGAVASNGERVLFTFIQNNGDLRMRLMTSAGTFPAVDSLLAGQTGTERVVHARVAPVGGGGFVVAARWAQIAATGPGRIELFRIDATGVRVGDPILVTDRSASDVDTGTENREAFSIASRPDGTVLVAWHTCGTLGDGSQCGVFGRILRDTGEPLTPAFGLATTTEGDQKRPSVVGLPEAFVAMWTDGSAKPPDTAGQSVRARIVYPPGASN